MSNIFNLIEKKHFCKNCKYIFKVTSFFNTLSQFGVTIFEKKK